MIFKGFLFYGLAENWVSKRFPAKLCFMHIFDCNSLIAGDHVTGDYYSIPQLSLAVLVVRAEDSFLFTLNSVLHPTIHTSFISFRSLDQFMNFCYEFIWLKVDVKEARL